MTLTIQCAANLLDVPGAPSWGIGAAGVVFAATGSDGSVATATTDARGWCAIPVPAAGAYAVTVAAAPGMVMPAPGAETVQAGKWATRVYLHAKPALGMYAGLPTAAAADLPKMTAALGRMPTLINMGLDYTQPKTMWTSNAQWATNALLASGTGLTPCISLPMGSQADGDTAALFATISSGGLDYLYRAMFVALTKGPPGYLRIGWEQNGNWYPWSVALGQEGTFVGAFQHLASLARQMLPGWRIVWNPAQVYQPLAEALATYPGDAWVDVVGVDAYSDSYWGHCDCTGLASFATQRGKPMAVCEAGTAGDVAFPARLMAAISGPRLEYLTIWSCHKYDFVTVPNAAVAAAWSAAVAAL